MFRENLFPIAILVIGVLLMAVGIALVVRRRQRAEGENSIKILGIEIRTSTPSLFIFAAGLALVLVGFVKIQPPPPPPTDPSAYLCKGTFVASGEFHRRRPLDRSALDVAEAACKTQVRDYCTQQGGEQQQYDPATKIQCTYELDLDSQVVSSGVLFVKLDLAPTPPVAGGIPGRDAAATVGSPNQRAQAQAVWRQGYKLNAQGDKAGAVRAYEQAKAIDPEYAAPYNSLGRMAGDRDAGADEQKLYKEALARDPNYAPALHNLALAYAQQGDTKKAIDLEQRAAALSKADSAYAETLADLQRRAK